MSRTVVKTLLAGICFFTSVLLFIITFYHYHINHLLLRQYFFPCQVDGNIQLIIILGTTSLRREQNNRIVHGGVDINCANVYHQCHRQSGD